MATSTSLLRPEGVLISCELNEKGIVLSGLFRVDVDGSFDVLASIIERFMEFHVDVNMLILDECGIR